MSRVTLDYAVRCAERPPEGRAAAYKFAEWDPAIHLRADGTPLPAWEAAWITRVPLVQPLPYLDGAEVTRVAVHRKAAPYLARALGEIHKDGLWDFLAPYGGGFNFRRIRGAAGLSMHALGLALDFDPERNPYHGDPNESRFGASGEGRAVVRLFEINGWFWGGRFEANPDAQHFQFATGV
jgi:hypothetical protein